MAESKLEQDLLKQICLEGLHEGMVRELRFHPQRRWRLDFAWPDNLLACEVNGGVWTRGRHSRPRGLLNDWEKASEAAILGWRLVIVSGLEVRNGAAIDRIKRALQWNGKGNYRQALAHGDDGL